MFPHPRINILYYDQTWEEKFAMESLEWEVPNTDKLKGHAKYVALLGEDYMVEINTPDHCVRVRDDIVDNL
jgi:hypothetical protein